VDVAFHATEIEELKRRWPDQVGAARRESAHARERPFAGSSHGGLIPDGYPERIAELGVWVVRIRLRPLSRTKYAADPGLTAYLYRATAACWMRVQVTAGSDAPVTPARPLNAIAAAATAAR